MNWWTILKQSVKVSAQFLADGICQQIGQMGYECEVEFAEDTELGIVASINTSLGDIRIQIIHDTNSVFMLFSGRGRDSVNITFNNEADLIQFFADSAEDAK